jgi:hypothetical protein
MPGVGRVSVGLFIVGSVLMSAGWGLFLRMVSDLNRVLPPAKKILLLEYRMHVPEITRLYEDSFPESTRSTAWRALIGAGAIAIAGAVIVEVIRTSK